MATISAQPLSSLAATPVVIIEEKQVSYTMTNGWGALILWFIIIAVIAWFILYSLRPTFVQTKDPVTGQPTGEIDAGRVLLASIVIALVIIIIIWLIRSSCSRF